MVQAVKIFFWHIKDDSRSYQNADTLTLNALLHENESIRDHLFLHARKDEKRIASQDKSLHSHAFPV